ncbi:MAG: tetratricopeptide repeat protein [Planctomycetota bacterium]
MQSRLLGIVLLALAAGCGSADESRWMLDPPPPIDEERLDRASVHSDRGTIRFKQKKYREAIEEFEKAVKDAHGAHGRLNNWHGFTGYGYDDWVWELIHYCEDSIVKAHAALGDWEAVRRKARYSSGPDDDEFVLVIGKRKYNPEIHALAGIACAKTGRIKRAHAVLEALQERGETTGVRLLQREILKYYCRLASPPILPR